MPSEAVTLGQVVRHLDGALAASADVARHVSPACLPAVVEAAARNGLAAEHGGHALLAWCVELADIAAAGLRHQAARHGYPDERPHLDPGFEALDRGSSPGTLLIDSGGPFTPAAVIPRIESGRRRGDCLLRQLLGEYRWLASPRSTRKPHRRPYGSNSLSRSPGTAARRT
jgi:hypothetical protein